MLTAGAQQVWKGEFSASKELLQVSVSPLCVYPAMPSGMSGGGQRCPWSTCSLPSPAGVTAPAASPSTGGPRAAGEALCAQHPPTQQERCESAACWMGLFCSRETTDIHAGDKNVPLNQWTLP